MDSNHHRLPTVLLLPLRMPFRHLRVGGQESNLHEAYASETRQSLCSYAIVAYLLLVPLGFQPLLTTLANRTGLAPDEHSDYVLNPSKHTTPVTLAANKGRTPRNIKPWPMLKHGLSTPQSPDHEELSCTDSNRVAWTRLPSCCYRDHPCPARNRSHAFLTVLAQSLSTTNHSRSLRLRSSAHIYLGPLGWVQGIL
jgi:hypothetical protein